MRKIVSVPHSEIKAHLDREKEAKKLKSQSSLIIERGVLGSDGDASCRSISISLTFHWTLKIANTNCSSFKLQHCEYTFNLEIDLCVGRILPFDAPSAYLGLS
jgi:hypothetical protein